MRSCQEAAIIPARDLRTKNKRPHVVPLAPTALALLEAQPRVGEAVFKFTAWSFSRISLVAAISATYALLSARELWYARDRDLLSRWPTLGW
jgi:hypothetical protein